MYQPHQPIDQSIREHSGLVFSYIHAIRQKNNAVDIEDLIQAGHIGLWQAILRYDPEHNVQFSTYASVWIRKNVLKWIYDNDHLIRIPDDYRKEKRHEISRRVRCSPLSPGDAAYQSFTQHDWTLYDDVREQGRLLLGSEWQVIEMRFLREMTYKEISEILQCSREMARKRVWNAMSKLRNSLWSSKNVSKTTSD